MWRAVADMSGRSESTGGTMCWLKDGECSGRCIAYNPRNEGSIYQCRILDLLESLFQALQALQRLNLGEDAMF